MKGGCTSHQIHNVQVEDILLREIREITSFARKREDEFVQLVTKQNEKELNRQLRESHRELEQAEQRIAKLDTIIQRLYEDNIDGKITDHLAEPGFVDRHDHFDNCAPESSWTPCLEHAEKIGLGSRKYELVTL